MDKSKIVICKQVGPNTGFACWVYQIDRIIPTVGKHVVSEETLAGGNEGVCIDESAPLGVIVAGLEVIQPGVYGTLLATGPFLALSGRREPSVRLTDCCSFKSHMYYNSLTNADNFEGQNSCYAV